MVTLATSETISQSSIISVEARYSTKAMRGQSQARLMYCSNRSFYVVKDHDQRKRPRALAGEMLATLIAIWIGLPFPSPALVEVPEKFCPAGMDKRTSLQLGSEFVERSLDVFPVSMFGRISNRRAFAGVLAFDKWTGNTDRRQAVFVNRRREESYKAVFIDNGNCFDLGKWGFPDRPADGGFLPQTPYLDVLGWESFEPWLTKIEEFSEPLLFDLAGQIPRDWYAQDSTALHQLCHEMLERRKKVRKLIAAFRSCWMRPFPNWDET